MQLLQEAVSADCKNTNIRLRDGEYQYSLVKAIASFQLELHFPDVQEIIKALYGEEKAGDLQFVRKIQTILKKMEKSDIVRILPKKKPWELQRYALSSYKFQDSDRNLVSFATDEQIIQAQNLLRSALSQQQVGKLNYSWFSLLVFVVVASYASILWSLLQPVINPIVFVPALSVSVVCSLILGRMLSRE
jgi:prepilin signal peptidase PulO-like enzyme (type II secretory pathway)